MIMVKAMVRLWLGLVIVMLGLDIHYGKYDWAAVVFCVFLLNLQDLGKMD